jgi:nucleoside-diphosphate-sugar epimerase
MATKAARESEMKVVRMMKIAVAGSTGILGRAVIPLLLQQGYEVRALARSAEKAKKIFPQNVEIVECDLLSPDFEQAAKPLVHDCDTVLHIATAIPRDFTAPNAWDANTRLRIDVVRTLLKTSIEAGVKRYIQQSITMAYPDSGDNWITEDTQLDKSPERAWLCSPVITMEEMIRNIPPHDLHWCILRGGTFGGKGTFQDRDIEALRAGKGIVPCSGKNFISLIHVADMATAVVAALEHAPAASVFNIVDEPMRQHEYSDRLAISIGADKPLRNEKINCPPSWRCSNQHARSVLNWSPTHDIIPK